MAARSIWDIAASVRGRRKDLGMSQAQLAERAGVSRKWIYEFEAGKPRAELGLLLRILEQLDLAIEFVPPPTPTAMGAIDLDAYLDEHRTNRHTFSEPR